MSSRQSRLLFSHVLSRAGGVLIFLSETLKDLKRDLIRPEYPQISLIMNNVGRLFDICFIAAS
jgi:hypothetical protein